MEKSLLITSPFIIASILLLGYGIGYFEMAILRKNFQFAVVGVPAIGIGLVNILLLFLVLLVWIEYFYSMNWFVAVVATVIIVVSKLIAYRSVNLSVLYACLSPLVFFGSVKGLILLAAAAMPDESTLEASVKNNALLKLRIQMFMGGSHVRLQRPVETAFETNNVDALTILYAYGNDQELMIYGGREQSDSMRLKALQLMIVYGKKSNPGYQRCFYYSMQYDLPQLEFALDHGSYKTADFPDAMVEAVRSAMTYSFPPEATRHDSLYDDFDKKIKRLTDYGFDINARTQGSNATALLNFLEEGNANEEKVLQILLHHNADVNLPTLGGSEWLNWREYPAGTTPLMMAARKGEASYVQILLHAGADKTRKDANGKIALDYAADNDLKVLLQ